MPKQVLSKGPKGGKPAALYDHGTRKTVTRQLNVSRNESGRTTSYSYSTSRVQLAQLPQAQTEPEHSIEAMPVDAVVHVDQDADHPMEAMPVDTVVHVDQDVDHPLHPVDVVAKPKERSYENSVSLL